MCLVFSMLPLAVYTSPHTLPKTAAAPVFRFYTILVHPLHRDTSAGTSATRLAPVRSAPSYVQTLPSQTTLLQLGDVGACHEDAALAPDLLDAALQVDVPALAPRLAPAVLYLRNLGWCKW